MSLTITAISEELDLAAILLDLPRSHYMYAADAEPRPLEFGYIDVWGAAR
jgi:hypothetical protein